MSEDTPTLIPAATVILLRDRASGLETLMLRRNARLEFVGGMWVFPGGRVDAADRRPDEAAEDLAPARRAAVREAHEEAGLVLQPDALLPYSHWCPPASTPKRFSTWFFVAEAPRGAVEVDGGEIHEHRWLQPGEVLRERDRGALKLAPPTWVTLWELARHRTTATALEATAHRRPESYTTRMAQSPAGHVALWHGDAGYDSGDPSAPGPRHRLTMADAGWHFERS